MVTCYKELIIKYLWHINKQHSNKLKKFVKMEAICIKKKILEMHKTSNLSRIYKSTNYLNIKIYQPE